jgi:hypothetical protein
VVSFVDKALRDRQQLCTDENRARLLFSPQGTVYEAWYTLKQAFDEGYSDQIHCIEYDDLVSAPADTMTKLYAFLDITPFDHDFVHIVNKTPEDDMVYNMPGLHTIRPVLEKTAPDPREVLGQSLYDYYAAVPHFWRQQAKDNNPLRLRSVKSYSV